MTRLPRTLASLSCWLLAACSGTGAARDEGGEGSAVLVALRDFRSGESFELASESHTDRLTYYSGARSEAARKIQTDEIMSAFVSELERLGFDDHAQPGRAPSIASNDVIRWGIEVHDGAQSTHWLIGTGSAPADWSDFQKCRDTFLQLYNITVSYQAVKNESGKQYFDDKKSTAAGQKLP